ncbi:MAG: ATP-dependent Clp protease ATP-binding subunit [Thermodesulfobacteriota bacterium]
MSNNSDAEELSLEPDEQPEELTPTSEPELDLGLDLEDFPPPPQRPIIRPLANVPLLTKFGRDLCLEAAQDRLPEIIGRKMEMTAVARCLLKRVKNNPLLVGDPGVGKTAVVEGLANLIASGCAPPEFRFVHIIEIRIAELLAGTNYRGDFEKLLTGLILEVEKNPRVVLFMDELHTVIGAGVGGKSTLDAANILKPALGRGRIRVIGATTVDEYQTIVANDPAFDRRFEIIEVKEPAVEETVDLLRALRARMEQHYNVTIAPEVFPAAVRLSRRYMPDRFLPDKAIDLLDQACVQARVPQLGSFSASETAGKLVNLETLESVVAARYGIPAPDIHGSTAHRFRALRESLERHIVGQESAVQQVANAINTAQLHLRSSQRPQGVFLLVGPSGSGKTEMAARLAEALFPGERSLLRLDMGEFMEAHSVNRLVGAPPGYIGYDRKGQLTSFLWRKPYSLVLLEGVEKAHSAVLDLFLQIFSEGRLTDAQGRTVNAREAFFVMTTNLGDRLRGEPPAHMGFIGGPANGEEWDSSAVTGYLSRTFRSDFLNCVDEVICFQELAGPALRQLAEKKLAGLQETLKRQGIALTLSDQLLDVIADFKGNGHTLHNRIEKLLCQPLALALATGEISRDKEVRAVWEMGRACFVVERSTELALVGVE